MKEEVYSRKQLALLQSWQRDELSRINLLEGSVRSGKTWISLVVWAFWVATMPKDGAYLMVAKTLTSLKRNTLVLLEALVGKENFTYSLAKKEAKLFGRTVYLEGVSDSRAESKIRGMTLQGAYCDELTLFSEDFFTMLLSRLSARRAKVFATTNPDGPHHWLLKKYIARCKELDMQIFPFVIEDNIFLDKDYVASLKQEYTGVFYQRFILGKWVAAEGLIFPNFAHQPEKWLVDTVPFPLQFITVGVDFGGNKSKTTFVATGFSQKLRQLVVVDEYKLAGAKGTIDPARLEAEFVCFLRKLQGNFATVPILAAFCDNEAQTLLNGLRSAVAAAGLKVPIADCCKATIIERIYTLNGLLSTGRFWVLDHCQQVVDSLCQQVWDGSKTGDIRLDNGTVDIDIADALEYSFSKFLKLLI